MSHGRLATFSDQCQKCLLRAGCVLGSAAAPPQSGKESVKTTPHSGKLGGKGLLQVAPAFPQFEESISSSSISTHGHLATLPAQCQKCLLYAGVWHIVGTATASHNLLSP